jgi:hypothetical protein
MSPFSRQKNLVCPRSPRSPLKKTEIIIWVSLSIESAVRWNSSARRLPAILDTGHTHNFAIQHQHLARWAGIQPEMLRQLGHIRHYGQRMPIRAAAVWLHRNEPRQMTVSSDQPLFLDLPSGIAVFPDDADYPRLPLLGLRAILSNNLLLTVDGKHASVTLRTPDWRTRLLTWLA